MGTRTQSDLTTQILVDLTVVPEGMAAEIDDIARVTASLQSLFDELAGREIVYIPDPQNIPDAWFLSVSAICAYELRKTFGVTGDAANQLKIANDEAIGKLKTMTRGKPTYEPLRTVTF